MSDPRPPRRSATYLWAADDPEAGTSFDRQRRALADFATARQLAPVAEFLDRGATPADPFAVRPGLIALFAAICRSEVDVALVERADRLSADPLQRELVLHELQQAGIQLVAADTGEDLTAEPARDATAPIRAILAAATEFGSHASIAAIRLARPRLSEQARARHEILRLRERNLNFASIARHLNAMGLRDPAGAPWTRDSAFACVRQKPPPA